MTNERRATGGAKGGYIATRFDTLVGAIAATSRGTYLSPAFTYDGVGGKQPKKLVLAMSQKANIGALLDILGTSANFSVAIVPKAGGKGLTVISKKSLSDKQSWTKLPAKNINPSQLKRGHSYRIKITSELQTPLAAVIESGYIGYDNIALKATAPKSHGHGHGHGHGHKPIRHIRRGIRHGIGNARLTGHHLKVPMKCPKAAAPGRCAMKVRAQLKRHGRVVTQTKHVRIKAGHRRLVRLHVKRGAVSSVRHHKHLWVRARVHAKGTSFVVAKFVRVHHAHH